MNPELGYCVCVRFDGQSRLYFFVGWALWLLALCALALAYFNLRSGDVLNGYRIEAYTMLLGPFLCIGLADRFSMQTYEAIWRQLNGPIGPIILDRGLLEALRVELHAVFWLRPFSPPSQVSIEKQLASVARWLPALTTPPGGPFSKRFGEWTAGTLALTLGPVLALSLSLGIRNQLGFGLAAAVAATGLSVCGNLILRLAARQQALSDYFSAWRSEQGIEQG